MTKEQKFYNALKDIFVGAKVEGESGYINLMRIKSRYYEKGVFPKLQKDIEKAVEPFPEFKEELFDKLYTFFQRYFSESGSIYFRYTPIHQNVYEKIYTDDKDVILFWKTHMLYYVKTDRLFKNLEVDIDGYKFFFDVSALEHKKANEKREIIFKFKEKRKDGIPVFNVSYSERGKKTKTDDILRSFKKEDIEITEDILERAFRVFEKQSEVDYFINKNAKEFLREQFNIWLYQYVFQGMSEWTEKRIKQLQVLKDIAFKIIDFISQFEDELVKIWNKSKFVLNSNYVITLDRIAEKDKELKLIEKILKHRSFETQVKEWKELGIIDDKFEKSKIIENDLTGRHLSKKYQHLPIDTRYFKDLELEILGLFDDLDNSLDGWLIKSENYQALNTILPKFKEKVQTIYIDPPYNTGSDEFIYKDKFQYSSWLTMMENRLRLARKLMKEDGLIFNSIDYNEHSKLDLIYKSFFNFISDISVKVKAPSGVASGGFIFDVKENILVYTKGNPSSIISNNNKIIKEEINECSKTIESYNLLFIDEGEEGDIIAILNTENGKIEIRSHHGYKIEPININKLKKEGNVSDFYLENFKKIFTTASLSGGIEKKIKKLIPDKELYSYYHIPSKGKFAGKKQKYYVYKERQILWLKDAAEIVKRGNKEVLVKLEQITNLVSEDWWQGIANEGKITLKEGKKPEKLLKMIIELSSNEKDLILDFFLGSGTTTAVAHKLSRKWIGIEMGEYFESLVLRRMKHVLSGEETGISKDINWQGGGFFKYYELEQYEDTLRKVKYEDSDLFDNPYQDNYNQYVFMKDLKMLEALEIDYENNKVKVDFSKLYPNIDIPETLSNLLGKWIKKINYDFVEFEDGERIDLKNLDYKLIKPLIWW